MFKKLKEKTGYVSIETIVITGLILALGIVIISTMALEGKEISAESLTRIYEAEQKLADPGYTPIIEGEDYYN